MAVPRQDYAFPFRIDPGSRQAAQAGYADHVDQMIRQVLLTTPGERADLPELGCGLRTLLFAPSSEALAATVRLLVQQALERWLAGHLTVKDVVLLPTDDENEILLQIEYVLLATRAIRRTEVEVT